MTKFQAIDGVEDVHDLHIWSISSNSISLTCHIRVRESLSVVFFVFFFTSVVFSDPFLTPFPSFPDRFPTFSSFLLLLFIGCKPPGNAAGRTQDLQKARHRPCDDPGPRLE